MNEVTILDSERSKQYVSYTILLIFLKFLPIFNLFLFHYKQFIGKKNASKCKSVTIFL